MAPQKTVAIKQQPQQQHTTTTTTTTGRKDSADRSSDAKSRKRKANKQQADRHNSQEQQTIEATRANGSGPNNSRENLVAVALNSNEINNTEKVQPLANKPSDSTNTNAISSLVSSEQTAGNNKKQPQQQQLNHVPIVAGPVIAKQLSRDEPDDIDAGIELDGSSNSGSSVKDISEEQSKSMSVSPVMAQSGNLVNDNCLVKTKPSNEIEVAPIEQLSSDSSSKQDEMITSGGGGGGVGKKLGVTTKQQLAANQQVIDADEQQLQQKLQNKQRRSSTQSNGANNLNTSNSSSNNNNTSHQQQQQHHNASPQSPAICKVCEQHVYQMERMLAEKAVYHKRCFRCHQCKIQLRVDNYSSHLGQVYCKAHHRQIFQPQVKLDNADDVDIVAKSTTRAEDDYLAQRGRLSDLSFSFLQVKPEGIRKRQMIICENEPAELPKDVVRCDTKVDDGFEQMNVNLNNILEKFERGGGEESQPSSAGIVIDKPSFNLKKTLMAFEKQTISSTDEENNSNRQASERPIVKKLTNLNGIFNRQNSSESESASPPVKPLAIRRSESLMMRLKKYESRIAGESVDEDCESTSDEDENNNNNGESESKKNDNQLPKKLSSINLSTLRNQWENGDISKRRLDGGGDDDNSNNADGANDDEHVNKNGNSSIVEKKEELHRIRQQLARKKSGEAGSSIKNIYENAIREAQLQQTQQASRRNSNDLLALNGFSTSEIQQQLLQNGSNQNVKTPTTPNKDHFQLNMSNKANKLKAKFEQGLITNNSQDDSDQDDGDQEPTMSKLDQIRHEKMEDLSIFTEGEIKARQARNMFQQIDRRLSAANGQQQQQQTPPNPRSLSTISASMRSQLLNQMNQPTNNTMPKQTTPENQNQYDNNHHHLQGRPKQQVATEKQPIRLTNNVRI